MNNETSLFWIGWAHCPDYACRNSHWRYFIEKLFWRILLCWGLFLIKLQAFRPVTLLKRDSNTGVFLWISHSSLEHLFWRTSVNGCFCLWQFFYIFQENLLYWAGEINCSKQGKLAILSESKNITIY